MASHLIPLLPKLLARMRRKVTREKMAKRERPQLCSFADLSAVSFFCPCLRMLKAKMTKTRAKAEKVARKVGAQKVSISVFMTFGLQPFVNSFGFVGKDDEEEPLEVVSVSQCAELFQLSCFEALPLQT